MSLHFLPVLAAFLGSIFLSACSSMDAYQHHDPHLKLSKDAYEEKLTKPSLPQERLALPAPLPTLSTIPASFLKKDSLSTVDSIPLKDVLLSLAQQAEIGIIVDSKIQGGITFHTKEKPFLDIIKAICRMKGLRYKIMNELLRIEPDTPFLKSYNVQYLSLTQENQSRISIATDVFTAVDGRNKEIDNGSNTLLTDSTKSDFWSELEANLQTILMQYAPQEGQETKSFSVHRQGGILSVFANQSQHKEIETYLLLLEKSISSQVLIEAKIVEVNLKDEFKSGINWNSLKGDFALQAPLGSITIPGPFKPETLGQRDVFTIGGHGNHLSGVLNLLNRFGTVRTLSSPRLTVMNNQSAILKVATNRVFFRLDYDRDYGYLNDREREHFSSEIQTVPVGLVMVVHPSINFEKGRILMSLRPTISRVVDEKEDPAVSIASKQTQKSLIPQMQVRELKTLVNLRSGDTTILGGLMEERSDDEDSGVPGLSDAPLLGGLFKGKTNERTVTELVIFVTATIIDSTGNRIPLTQETTLSPADQQVYETFTRDPRPLSFNKARP